MVWKSGAAAMFFEERVADLTRKMLRKKLYVLLSKPVVEPGKLQPFLSAHLEYMIGLEKNGVLFASGPLTATQGQPAGDGLTILRAASAAEAHKIAAADPFVANSLRTFEVREWTVMEGSLGLTIHFSDQSLEIV